jgi:hypothetical protein
MLLNVKNRSHTYKECQNNTLDIKKITDLNHLEKTLTNTPPPMK